MSAYRLVIQIKDENGNFVNDEIIFTGKVERPESILDMGLRHSQQIDIIQKVQDNILLKQSIYLKEDIVNCPKCGHLLNKNGLSKSSFNAVFTDHKVPVQRQICPDCKWSSIPSVNSLFGTNLHPDLIKIQCEESVTQSYSKASDSLNRKSCKKRTVNSTMSISNVVDNVGNHIGDLSLETQQASELSKDLVIQVDGGHIKSKGVDTRSFEALISTVYSLENVKRNPKNGRGTITLKHSSASALNDNQLHIRKSTINAAYKEGMGKDTDLTALCDGADNCWSVIDALSPHCNSITKILDWFHIGMKFKNIGTLSELEQEEELLDGAKWSLWHGNIELCIERLSSLQLLLSDEIKINKIKKLSNYFENNRSKIVNYHYRKEQGLIFTSNLAECTVESLINQRCKGKNHMQWSRAGAHPILQIRASIASNEWCLNWEKYVVGAYQKAG
tara:strand:- start:183 stop:1520 length:1338 start_codon:yes stop_codon:yes gene_type:complete